MLRGTRKEVKEIVSNPKNCIPVERMRININQTTRIQHSVAPSNLQSYVIGWFLWENDSGIEFSAS